MFLRSGKSLSSQMDFDSCCIQQSKLIRAGGLWLPSTCQQVSEESYSSLAELNALGFLTVDSVDYIFSKDFRDNSRVQVGIHPTVSGFMCSETLSRIKEKMNIPIFILPESDRKTGILLPNVCVIHHIIVDEIISDEDFDRMILPVNFYRCDNRGFNQSFSRLYWEKKYIQSLKKDFKLNIDEPLEFVTFIDMKPNNPTNEEYGLFSQLILALKKSAKVEKVLQKLS